MLYRTFLLAFVSLIVVCPAKGIEPFAGPKPIVVMLRETPLAPVMGAETPRIAVYENGDVIYSRGHGKDQTYFYAELSFPALASLINHVTPVTDLKNLKPHYSVTGATDEGTTLFYFNVDGKEAVTSVYGLRPDDDGGPKMSSLDKLPVELRELYHYLLTVDFTETRPWRPTYVEAMFWPYNETSEGVIHWPKGWPDLKSDRAIKRKSGYSIFLDSSMRDELHDFLLGEKAKGAVMIDGETWTVASRPVFPSEPVWRKAFSKVGDY